METVVEDVLEHLQLFDMSHGEKAIALHLAESDRLVGLQKKKLSLIMENIRE